MLSLFFSFVSQGVFSVRFFEPLPNGFLAKLSSSFDKAGCKASDGHLGDSNLWGFWMCLLDKVRDPGVEKFSTRLRCPF